MAHQKKEKPKEFSERMVLLNLKKMKKIQEFINDAIICSCSKRM